MMNVSEDKYISRWDDQDKILDEIALKTMHKYEKGEERGIRSKKMSVVIPFKSCRLLYRYVPRKRTLFFLISCYTLHMSNQIFLDSEKISPTEKLLGSIGSLIFVSDKAREFDSSININIQENWNEDLEYY